MRMIHFLAAAAAVGGVSAPLTAQSSYPYQNFPVQQPVPQPYPGQPGYGYNQGYAYGQQGYAYGQQGYAQNPVQQIIDQLLGNRYNVSDRTAISQCAGAAVTQAQAQYGGYNSRYGQSYGQPYGALAYGYANSMRVTAITDVQRRNSGLRVKGLMSSGYAGNYGNQYGYNQGRNYAAGDLTFRCNVDYRGAVTNVRISRNGENRR